MRKRGEKDIKTVFIPFHRGKKGSSRRFCPIGEYLEGGGGGFVGIREERGRKEESESKNSENSRQVEEILNLSMPRIMPWLLAINRGER